jgi:CubicO group peptidase (beta-lactamase class C family)
VIRHQLGQPYSRLITRLGVISAKRIVALLLTLMFLLSMAPLGVAANGKYIPGLDSANAIVVDYLDSSRSETDGMTTKISSNAHYDALAPDIYFTWIEKQSDDAYLVVNDSFFLRYTSLDLIIQCANQYRKITVSSPGTYLVAKVGGKNINMAWIGNFREHDQVRLAPGSEGVAGEGMVIGLTPGKYYLVEVGGPNKTTMYVQSDGTLSDDPHDLSLLWGDRVTGLANGTLYNFTSSSAYPLEYPGDHALLEKVEAVALNEFNYRTPDRNLVGMAVAIIKDGRIHYRNYGHLESDYDQGIDSDDDKRPVTEDTLFEIASQSKVYTGYLLSYLHNQGYLSMHDPISLYFELPPYITVDGDEIHPTVEQLASHFSGFPRMPNNWDGSGVDKDPDHPYEFYTLERMEDELRHMVYLNMPGTQYQYSNLGVGVLGNVLAKAYYGDQFPEKGYNDLLQELICEPLGLESTTVYTNEEQQARKALPHGINGRPSFAWEFDALAGCGGIKSTTHDMILWLAMQLGEYVPDQELYAAFEQVGVPRSNMDQNGRAYIGLNWHLQPNRRLTTAQTIVPNPGTGYSAEEFEQLFPPFANAGSRYGTLYWHNGVVNGYGGEYMICPETGAGVVVLINNRDGGAVTDVIAARIMDWVLASDSDAKDSKVKLAPGSEGIPGDRSIIGLEPGKYYRVTVTTPTPSGVELVMTSYVKANGEITPTLSEAGPLAGTEIASGGVSAAHILNGNTYMVDKSDTPFPDPRDIRSLVGNMARQVFDKTTVVPNTSPPRRFDLVGMSLGYMEKNGDVSFVNFGTTSAGGSIPVTEDTVFEIAGTSLQFKSALVEYMKNLGYIDMNDTLDQYIDIAPYMDAGEPVYPTLEQLFLYRAGIKYPAVQSDFIGYSHDQLLNALKTAEYNYKPGAQTPARVYYEVGVLGAVLVEAYNTHPSTTEPVANIHELLRILIFDPLRMTNTAIDSVGLTDFVRANPHTVDGRNGYSWSPGIFGLNNGVESSSRDMMTWYSLCADAITATDVSQLSELQRSIRTSMGKGKAQGWGHNVNNGLYFYAGKLDGYNCMIIINPATDVCAYVAFNNQDPTATGEVLAFNIVQNILSK